MASAAMPRPLQSDAPGLDVLAQSAEYAHSTSPSYPPASTSSQPKIEQAPRNARKRSFHSSAPYPQDLHDPAAQSNGPVRRRITRACDRCNSLRTKCDGADPCVNCLEATVPCEYKREKKKRGKASTKDRQPDSSGNPAHNPNGQDNSNGESSPSESRNDAAPLLLRRHSDAPTRAALPPLIATHSRPPPQREYSASSRQMVPSPAAFEDLNGQGQYFPASHHHQQQQQARHHAPPLISPAPPHVYQDAQQLQMQDYPQQGYFAPAPNGANGYIQQAGRSSQDGSISGWLGGLNSAQSPGRFSLPSMGSPSAAAFRIPASGNFDTPALKYPVLRPVLPHITNIIPVSLACELIELYFASANSAFQHPSSPYIIGYVFRKRSFLHPTNPRLCSPALLSSMLWIAAQTSGAPYLTASIAARGKVCQKLLELTIQLLKPLVHQPNSGDDPSVTVINGVALGGFGVNVNLPLPGGQHTADMTQITNQKGAEVDDLAAYIHLATVISASEYKAASIRWWSTVWSLARELRFGRELPRMPEESNIRIDDGDMSHSTPHISEESREERRRIWWLAYTVDRHLALCYNRPISLRDIDCIDLYRPVSESHWQEGDSYMGPPSYFSEDQRPRGPGLECTDHSIFGFFTPLMTILGECIELQQARAHPRLGVSYRPRHEWDTLTELICGHIDTFADSVARFRATHLPEHLADPTTSPHTAAANAGTGTNLTEHHVQTIVVLAYAEHILHVMHVVLAGRWDPLTLLDDADDWISSPSFVTATGHAVDAAEALSPILEFDPDLSFMPWFFGIYLLQGSFLLLLFADKLGKDASERYVGACERCVRAMEACVVTLNTEYQRNFRRVMRSALAQVRGRVPVDQGEQQLKRREVLALYRWTGDGTGLAL